MSTATSYRKMACPFCSGKIEYDAKDDGALTTCPHCQQDIELLSQAEPARARYVPVQTAKKPTASAIVGWVIVLVASVVGVGLLAFADKDQGSDAAALLVLIFGLVASVILYFGPTILAGLLQNRNVVAIGLINFFFGWTVLGWVAALIWAVYQDKK